MSVYVLDVYKGTKGATSTSIAPIKVATIMLNILPPAYDAVDKVQGLPGTLLPGKFKTTSRRKSRKARRQDFVSYPYSKLRRTATEMKAVAAFWGGDFLVPHDSFLYDLNQVANEPYGSNYDPIPFTKDVSA